MLNVNISKKVTTKIKVVRLSGNNKKGRSSYGHLLFHISSQEYFCKCTPTVNILAKPTLKHSNFLNKLKLLQSGKSFIARQKVPQKQMPLISAMSKDFKHLYLKYKPVYFRLN